MQSILTVTTAATDLTLLTMADLRQAAGVESGKDAELEAFGRRIAAAITSHCNVCAAGATPPTLRLETLTQTFRLDCPADKLILARRPLVEIVSVTEDAVAVESDNYENHADAGFLLRLCDDDSTWWSASKIVVAYRAGWATVPENVRTAAMKLAAVLWSEGQRSDPGLRSEEIPGVISRAWWVGPTDDPLIAREIEELLADYINPAIG